MYITLDAGRQIHKLLEKQGLAGRWSAGRREGRRLQRPELRLCWEAATERAGPGVRGPRRLAHLRRSEELPLLEGTQIDFDTSLLSKGFVVVNPKAKATCGCGTSFSLS